MKTKLFGLLTAISMSLLVVADANAGPAITSYVPGTDFTNAAWSLGWEFQVGSGAITVTDLGVYDDFANDFTESHEVGIYDLSGTLLVSGTVNPGDILSGFFRYTSVAPTNLAANTNYIVTAATRSENYGFFPSLITFDPAISYVRDRFQFSNTLVFPSNSTGFAAGEGIYGGTFGFIPSVTAVPEPSSMVMLGLGALGMAFARRGRNKKHTLSA